MWFITIYYLLSAPLYFLCGKKTNKIKTINMNTEAVLDNSRLKQNIY